MSLVLNQEEYALNQLSDEEMVFTIEINDELKLKYSYKVSGFPSEDKPDNIIVKESNNDVYQYVIDKAREQFGDKIDLKEVYGPANYLYPVIDLNELQKELDKDNIR